MASATNSARDRNPISPTSSTLSISSRRGNGRLTELCVRTGRDIAPGRRCVWRMYWSFIRTLHVPRRGKRYTTYTLSVQYSDGSEHEAAFNLEPAIGRADDSCQVCRHGHSSELDRLEHWLLESGGLRRSTDLGEKGLPVTRPGGMDPRQSSPCLHRFPRDAPVAEGAL